ncbi:MAG TPA: efflux RND transporter periplasmic adaptor subunit [Acidobacteriaceae bacterium]|nr:efflux RND transporter periplasmic adaptor subunit [Acidobacteriaceae bacterium]
MQEDIAQNQSPDDSYVGRDHQLPPPESRPRRSITARILVWLLILLAFGILFWLVLRHHQTQKAAAGRRAFTGPVTLTTVTAKKGNIGVYLDGIGTVTPVYTDSITSQVTGLISEVHYREGQLVHRGEPLIDIDSRPFRAQLMQAEGALERDTNLLAQAKMDQERYRQAWARDAIPKQTLDDQEKIVLQYEGTVKVDQGTVQYDQVQVSFCHLVAPISGRVGLRLVDPGNVVQANSTTPLVVITQLQPITVVFTIAEDNIAQVEEQIRQGKTLQVTALDRTNQGQLATGKLQTIDNQIDTMTGTLKLRAVFANKNNALFPNLFVNTRLLVKTLEGVTLISTDAIQQNGSTSYVYVLRNGTAHLQDIQPGVADSGQTAVTGINPGDVVADSGFEQLQNNSRVVISKTPLPAASRSGSNAP